MHPVISTSQSLEASCSCASSHCKHQYIATGQPLTSNGNLLFGTAWLAIWLTWSNTCFLSTTITRCSTVSLNCIMSSCIKGWAAFSGKSCRCESNAVWMRSKDVSSYWQLILSDILRDSCDVECGSFVQMSSVDRALNRVSWLSFLFGDGYFRPRYHFHRYQYRSRSSLYHCPTRRWSLPEPKG
jgi:hypothetical protein